MAKRVAKTSVKAIRGKPLNIGVDFTTDEVRIAAVNRVGKTLVLERFAVAKLPPQIFAAGRVADPKTLGARIKDVLIQNGIKPKKALISLSGKAAITRVIELPKLGVNQTRQALNLQLAQYVPFPVADTIWEFRVLPPREEGNPAMQEVLLVATRTSTVQSLIETLRFAGIEPAGVKITSLAAANVLLQKVGDYRQSVCFIDIRDSVTDLSFYAKGGFRMSRPIEVGFNTIITKISQMLNRPVEEALDFLTAEKVNLSIPEEEIDPTLDTRLRDAVLSVMGQFVADLVRSIRYYESQAQRAERVGRLYLYGNISLFQNLDKYLSEQTGLEVFIVDPASVITVQPANYSLEALTHNFSKLITACGLSAEFVLRKKIELNLLPTGLYKREQTLKVAIGGVLLLLVLFAIAYVNNNDQLKKIADLESEKNQALAKEESYQPDAQKFDEVKNKIIAIEPKFQQIFTLFKGQLAWPPLLEELGSKTIDNAWINGVDFESSTNKMIITGACIDRKDLMKFVVQLDSSPFFTNTNLKEKIKTIGTGTGGPGFGSGGGGGGGGGIGGATGSGSPQNGGYGPVSITFEEMKREKVLASREPFQGFTLPKFGGIPGAQIEEFFEPEQRDTTVLYYEFEITCDFQGDILDPTKTLPEITKIEEEISDVKAY